MSRSKLQQLSDCRAIIRHLEEKVKALETEIGLLRISHNHKARLLESCEQALEAGHQKTYDNE